MLRCALLAGLGVALLTPAAPAQPAPYHWYHEGQRAAYPANPDQLVRAWYLKFLNREPDPQGREYWANSLRQGQPPDAVLSAVLGSQEYYDKCGDTPEGFIQTLFRDVAGRPPTPQEIDQWMRRMYDSGRTDIAYALLTRFPQSWNTVGVDRDEHRYEYRRPDRPYRP